MTLDGFLTLLALLVAIYTLIPRSTKLFLKLGKELQIIAAVIAFLLVLYSHFYEKLPHFLVNVLYLESLGLPSLLQNTISPSEFSFIVALCWGMLSFVIYKMFSMKWHSPLLIASKIVNDLIDERSYKELVEFIEPWLPLINKASHCRLPSQKFIKWCESMRDDRIDLGNTMTQYNVIRKSNRKKSVTRMRHWIGNLGNLFSVAQKAEIVSNDMIRSVCQSKEFRNYVIKEKPYFALSLFPMRGVKEFSDAYLTGLISNTNSRLYEEFEWNAKLPADIYPREGNQILGALFNDAEVAKRLMVWRPIAIYMLALMHARESPDPEFTASLNRKPQDFDLERWENPIYAGIYFFDVMVTAAAFQGIRWHMWLYYCSFFIEKLENIYDTSGPELDESDEFPTRSARLIYEVISVLQDWILLVKNLPQDSPHMKSDKFDLCKDHGRAGQTYRNFHDNRNIPVSAANVLGSCLKKIVLSERISDKFKGEMYKVAVDTTRELDDPWSALVIRCTVRGGSGMLNEEYGSKIYELLSQIDHLDRQDFYSDVTDAFKNIYGYGIQ